MKLYSALGALAIAAAMATGAQAADPVTMPMTTPMTAPSTFDWDGFYAGVGITGGLYSTPTTMGGIDAIVGANMTSGQMLFGAEGTAGYIQNLGIGVGSLSLSGEARAGYLVTPDAVLYLALGAKHYTNGSVTFGTVGGGAEFALTDNMSFDAEYKYLWGLNTGATAHEIGASLLWHFN